MLILEQAEAVLQADAELVTTLVVATIVILVAAV